MNSRPHVFDGSISYPSPSPRPVLTMGNFDGVHLGHRALLDRVVTRARKNHRPSSVYTFDPTPMEVLRPEQRAPRIHSLDERIRALGDAGIDHVVVERFDPAFANRDAQWFADEVIGRRLAPEALIVGWNFRFGRDRAGDLDSLRRWVAVDIETFGPFTLGGEVVSSSRIRQAVLEGEVETAARLLGRPHRLVGSVVHGDGRGRSLGFPTANIEVTTELLPARGVYAVFVILPDGTSAPGVLNRGSRPTFGSGESIEVHLYDGATDLYGQTLSIDLCARIREEHRFASAAELVEQIRQDIETARLHLGTVGA